MIQEIKNRRSIRQFKNEPVPDETIKEIIKAAHFAPSGRGIQAWEFFVIKDNLTKKKIAEIGQQEFLARAPVLILPVVDKTKTNLAVQDLALASGYLFLAAQEQGLGTVWKNLNSEQAKMIKKLLEIPENFLAINIIPVGRPAKKIPPHQDKDFDEKIIHFR